MHRPKVFLSYTQRDEDLIKRIAVDLKNCQIEAWYDKWEIKPGDPIRQRIFREAIPEEIDAFFVYLTPASINSRWVQEELDAALIEEVQQKGVRIFTYVDSADTLKLLRSDIASRNCPEINDNNYENGLRLLVRQVTEAAFSRENKQLRQQLEYVNRPTLRGIPFIEAIKSVGVTDIENRDHREHRLPPFTFYTSAQSELFVSGISLYNTFDDQDGASLRKLLDQGKQVATLIMNPDSEEAMELLYKREGKSIQSEIWNVIDTVTGIQGFTDYPNFQIHIMNRLPPFTAVALDCGIAQLDTFSASNSQVRIQPTTIHKTHHNGLVIQLDRPQDIKNPVIDFVIEELREQWGHSREITKSDLERWSHMQKP